MKIQRRWITSEFCTSFPVQRYQLVIINANPKPYIPLETSYCHQAWQIALFDICSLLHLQCQSQNWKPCKAWAPWLFTSSKTLPSSHFSSLGLLHPCRHKVTEQKILPKQMSIHQILLVMAALPHHLWKILPASFQTRTF